MEKRINYLLCVIFLCIVGCNSDTVDENLPITSDQTLEIIYPECAFPEIEGIVVDYPSGIQVTQKDTFFIWEGDIILSVEQISQLENQQTRSAIIENFYTTWPGGKVYYSFDANFQYQNMVLEAIAHWEANTSLRFYPRAYERDYVEFYHGAGNSSQLGRVGGKQLISLALNGSNRGTAIHEIGHAIGLFHEQSRVDRDEYITINWNNISNASEHNFRTYQARGIRGVDVGVFDFNSVMLYSSYSFSINGLPTIVKKNGSTFNAQRNGLSTSDILGVRAKYGPLYTKTFKELISSYEDLSSTYEDWEYIYGNYLEFYVDEARTMKVPIQFPATIEYSIYSYDCDYNRQSATFTNNINTASYAFLVCNTIDRGRYDYSYCLGRLYEEFYLTNQYRVLYIDNSLVNP